jgi:large repetitive protein
MTRSFRVRMLAGVGAFARPRILTALAVAPLLATAACDAGSIAPELDDAVAGLSLSILNLDLDRGDTARVTASLVNRNGAVIGSPSAGAAVNQQPVRWTTDDPSIADVSRSGLVLARREGNVTLTATAGNLVTNTRINVQPRGKSVIVAPKVDSLATPGHKLQLSVTVLNPSGREIPRPDVAWSSLNPQTAEVNAEGIVRAVAAGIAMIVVSANGQADTARIVVGGGTASQLPIRAVGSVVVAPDALTLDRGHAEQLRATVLDGSGSPLVGASPVWSSSDPAIASVDASGRITAHDKGEVAIRATLDGVSGSAAVIVAYEPPQPPVATTITVAPANLTIDAGQGAQLTATVRDQHGEPMPGAQVTWSSGNTAIATVDASGRVTGVGAGIASIRAQSDDRFGVAAVTVVAAPAPPPPGGGESEDSFIVDGHILIAGQRM